MTETLELPRALDSYFAKSNVALALSSDEPDVPLRLVNDAFSAMTGYSRAEVEGRNCRFLQGPDTSARARSELHDFIHDDSIDAGRFHVLNHRKDGSRFDNFVFMSRLRDADGGTRFILASQFDMSPVLDKARLRDNDRRLVQDLADIDRLSREYGLAMMGSARIIADSVAILARLAIDGR